MVGRLRKYHSLVGQYGFRRCLFRFTHDVKQRYGLLKRRFPAWQWDDRPLSAWLRSDVSGEPAAYRAFRQNGGPRFFFPPGQPPAPPETWLTGAVRESRQARAGTFRYFSRLEGNLGFPHPDWFSNPFTGECDSAAEHWCDRGDFDPERGDIKFIWEPSRFTWAYALVRAAAATRPDGCAETFWQLLESWLEANPPQMGPHWMCGQEIAIRVLACTFALHAFWDSPATTDARLVRLVVLLAASAERIAGNIDAARNQMGNHATSEAAGLWTVGVLFPELEDAARWREMGQSVLEDEARLYNFPDGSYTQHSMNYQRLMMHAYLWCLRLAELNGVSFSMVTRDRLARSAEFLYELQDASTGRLPNYGPNDGALILPLDDCDYVDYRPVIGATHYLMKRERLYEDGPWSEDLLWLFGPDALASPVRPVERTTRQFLDGGYFTLRGGESWGMVRCHSYHNRPNQADMLHLDLWWRGVNVLRDSGSFTYYDPATHWNRYFLSAAAHNTVTVGGQDQMIKGPRFQWYSLVQSRLLGHRENELGRLWQGEHYGYRRLPCRAVHRRSICRLGASYWLIIDDVLGVGRETIGLHWHLLDCPYDMERDAVVLHTPEGVCRIHLYSLAEDWDWKVQRGVDRDGERAGWESLSYGVRQPAPTIAARARTELPARFATLVGLGVSPAVLQADLADVIRWQSGDKPIELAVGLNPPRADRGPVTFFERDGQRCELGS